MNNHVHETALEILRKAGVAIPCPRCRCNEIRVWDDDAEINAYALASDAWKEEDQGFRTMTREEVMECMKYAILDVNNRCPICDRQW